MIHAFANAAMAGFVTGATVWHVNGDESRRMDDNLENRPVVDPYDTPGPYRSSDHDPLLVGVSGTVPAELISFTAE